ncbi:MAG: 16S rRNA (guanine(966)-N(2))-methyltransferase RsmD [Planctomycetes bacterium]|nr:16S rRNA (guanine(966)-N(2))-methyltransferase RsmD [Planctomycetota bacterium]
MRIIAGSARRISLQVAAGSSTRPFLEMARGALFNSLGPRVTAAQVLDLYAGSGALGLEALSRGAASGVFVERDSAAAAALAANIAACGFTASARAVRADVGTFLAAAAGPFDLIFVDPPFPELAGWQADGAQGGIMRDAARVLAAEGLLVFRLEDGKAAPPDWPGLELADDRRYGRSRVCRYRRSTPGDTP